MAAMSRECNVLHCLNRTTKYKACASCREKNRKSVKACRAKRKKKATAAEVEEGFKMCEKCCHPRPLADFVSTYSRRKEDTWACSHCRALSKASQQRENTKPGLCKAWFIKWKETNPCVTCGLSDARFIEHDHIISDQKATRANGKRVSLGEYMHWAYNGGPEAMAEEAKLGQALCVYHHRRKTYDYDGRPPKKDPKAEASMEYLRQLRRSMPCAFCERPCLSGEESAFEFDHIDPKTKKAAVSYIAKHSRTRKPIDEEIAKCQHLCCFCHKLKTYHEDISFENRIDSAQRAWKCIDDDEDMVFPITRRSIK